MKLNTEKKQIGMSSRCPFLLALNFPVLNNAYIETAAKVMNMLKEIPGTFFQKKNQKHYPK